MDYARIVRRDEFLQLTPSLICKTQRENSLMYYSFDLCFIPTSTSIDSKVKNCRFKNFKLFKLTASLITKKKFNKPSKCYTKNMKKKIPPINYTNELRLVGIEKITLLAPPYPMI